LERLGTSYCFPVTPATVIVIELGFRASNAQLSLQGRKVFLVEGYKADRRNKKKVEV